MSDIKNNNDLKIAIVGLGLIGGSLAKALINNYDVHALDAPQIVEKAVKEGAIKQKASALSNYDAVFLCVPPSAALNIIENEKFKRGALVVDFCGVKREIVRAAEKNLKQSRFVGCHPMAGREVSGYDSSRENLFSKASLIITVTQKTDKKAVELVKTIAAKAGFTRFPQCTPEFHDAKIAYTSQLAHVVSNAYVKSAQAEQYSGFTGGSFQDMTRIAGVDEKLWTELFLMNSDYLIEELDNLIVHLQEYERALKNNNREKLKCLLAEGKNIKKILHKNRAEN